jgi:hypothetical protein
MKHLVILTVMATSFAVGQAKPAQTQPTLTIVSVQPLVMGEAYDCPSIDMQWMEAHCFPPTKENLQAPKHKYLVKVTFDRPVEADKDGWAYDFTCRLDSYKAATCQWNKQRKPSS